MWLFKPVWFFDLPSLSDGCWRELPQRRVPIHINSTVRFGIDIRVAKVSSEYLLTSWAGSAGREGEAATALFGVFGVSSTTPYSKGKDMTNTYTLT